MKLISRTFVAVIAMFFAVMSFADTAKVGVVDLQKIMQTSTQMKNIQKKLEGQFKPRRDKLVAEENALKTDMEKFKRDAAVMNDTEKKALERKIVNAQHKFELAGQQYQQELSTAHNEAMEDLYGKIRKAISKVAQQEKFDLVVQKDAAPFSTAQLDLTDKVLKEIN